MTDLVREFLGDVLAVDGIDQHDARTESVASRNGYPGFEISIPSH